MAASQRLPKNPGTSGTDFATLAQSKLSASELRQQLEHAKAEDDENYRVYSTIVDKIVGDMIDLLRQGHDLDVSNLIDQMRSAELEAEERRREVEKRCAAALRLAAKKGPELLKALNDGIAAELESIDRLATLHRDARWRFMQARAQYKPSQGVGPIRGIGNEFDDLLKN